MRGPGVGPEGKEGRGSQRLGLRSGLAVRGVVAANRLVRATRFGQGTVLGGRVGLAIAPDLLRALSAGRRVALVSGTNGKTTTTRLLAAALGSPGTPGGPMSSVVPPVTNVTGANMPEGHVAALSERWSPTAALEVDESYLGQLVSATDPVIVVLLNLSRDQLDRIAEVRLVAERWRSALDAVRSRARNPGDAPVVEASNRVGGGAVVVANADDPLVVWAAEAAPVVVWVGAGQVWDEDSVGCPRCGGSLQRPVGEGWRCARCTFARPTPSVWTDGRDLVQDGEVRTPVELALPGGFNVANATMAAVAAAVFLEPRAVGDPGVMAVGCRTALAAMREVEEVGGRFGTVDWRGVAVRRLLAKNPAGWAAIFDLLDEVEDPPVPVVLAINARTADGLDTSWLWDVPFERLRGRWVVATGERARDLAVRLHYAGVDHVTAPDSGAALEHAAGRARGAGVPRVDFVGNYTAFARLPVAP
ncbi:MAG: MurT ligase domain-containing protein [Actinomycetota bacterium]|nr:MurT ligase domain-containing protein [Actinomycetota bacterium]MDA8342106.1 MurT ligase domain-containing protein [Actinomycetota bacterium]